MSEINSLRAELDDLTRLLEAAATAAEEEWSPEWIARQGLLRRQAELSHRLSLHEAGAEVEVRLLGGAESGSEVDSELLGIFLQQIQHAVTSTVQRLMHGERARGRFPIDVVNASRLRVDTAASGGSFLVQMTGPPGRHEQLTIDSERELPPFDLAIEQVLTLLEATADGADSRRVGDAIEEIGSHRAIEHVTHLARVLARTGTNATVTRRTRFGEPMQARVTAQAAESLQAVLSKTTQETTREFRIGRLSGVRWTRGIFDLEVALGDGETWVISGRVTTDLRPAVSALFDRDVRAELDHTVARVLDQPDRDSYLMIGISPFDPS